MVTKLHYIFLGQDRHLNMSHLNFLTCALRSNISKQEAKNEGPSVFLRLPQWVSRFSRCACRHMQIAGRIEELSRNVFIGQGGSEKMAASRSDVTPQPATSPRQWKNGHPSMTKLPHAINVFLML